MPRPFPFSESDLRAAIEDALCWADVLRYLGYVPRGSNFKTIKKYATRWNISTEHFDPHAGRRRAGFSRQVPLEDVLVENSTYRRGQLKERLFAAGIKRPECELCGQDDEWRGHPMSLILDHVNGVSNDHRLENLRVVCPNCAATFDTHCGRNTPRKRICPACRREFAPKHIRHRYCSQKCWGKVAAELYRGKQHLATRKVTRPSYEQLKADLQTMSFVKVGHKYGVSDNAIRKWLCWYEYECEGKAHLDTDATHTPPPSALAA